MVSRLVASPIGMNGRAGIALVHVCSSCSPKGNQKGRRLNPVDDIPHADMHIIHLVIHARLPAAIYDSYY